LPPPSLRALCGREQPDGGCRSWPRLCPIWWGRLRLAGPAASPMMSPAGAGRGQVTVSASSPSPARMWQACRMRRRAPRPGGHPARPSQRPPDGRVGLPDETPGTATWRPPGPPQPAASRWPR